MKREIKKDIVKNAKHLYKIMKKGFDKIEKIVINVGVGRLSQQAGFEDKILPEVTKELAIIAGQKPQFIKSKKSISGFKLRIGQIIGLKATLRRNKMVDFLERLVNIVLPRIRDFRGINLKNIDKMGNLTIGIKEKEVFPEINPEDSKIDFGLELTIVPKIRNKEESIELYRSLNIPLKKDK